MRYSLVVPLLALACTSPPEGDDTAEDPADPDAAGSITVPELPQFARLDGDGEGLTNVSSDLEALLEGGDLEGACDRFEAGETDTRTELLCGKWMFFYESFGTAGVPAPLVDFELTHLRDLVGDGFSEYGMVADPFSDSSRPLGFGPSDAFGDLPSLAFTCASCHFGRLPDGRYSVGAPNHAYAYGEHILALLIPPFAGLGVAGEHDAAAMTLVQPLVDAITSDPAKQQALTEAVSAVAAGLAGGGPGLDPAAFTLTPDREALYASWLPGTMDFLIEPLPVVDDVHTISKISPLWEVPSERETSDAGMRHAMLGWTGGTATLMNFLTAFVDFGGGPPGEWPASRLEPLAKYIETLRRPDPPDADIRSVASGAIVFADSGCGACHGGPRGSGLDLFDYDEIGTDDAMRRWFDADLDGEGCCGEAETGAGDEITHRLKSPRLVGLWAMDRFLHNGSVPTLEDLFCMHGERPTDERPAYSDRGHLYGCDLPESDRVSLVAFLRSL